MSVFSLNESSEDKCYGIPDQKKFPLPDEKHVLSAIKFFNYVDEEHEKQLASNIKKKIKEYDMAGKVHVGDKNRFKKYWNESVIEEGTPIETLLTTNPLEKTIILYHCSPHKLNVIKPVSFNPGTRLSHERMSSYWSTNPDFCILFSLYRLIQNSFDDIIIEFCSIDPVQFATTVNDDKKIRKMLKSKCIYLYTKEVDKRYVGIGHAMGISDTVEFTIDLPVKPDSVQVIDGIELLKVYDEKTVVLNVSTKDELEEKIESKFKKSEIKANLNMKNFSRNFIVTHHNEVLKRYSKRYKKELLNTESAIEESVELDAEVMKVYQYPLPSVMPYFTPDEMENMGVFSEDAEKNYYGVKTKNPYAKEWFDTYKATGDPGDNYLQKLLPVIDKKMKEPSYEHKQELLEWGWNPEIAFSEKVKPRMEQVREKILEQYGVTLISLAEDAVDDPFILAAVNIAKMCNDERSKIRADKRADANCFWLYTGLDELHYSTEEENHDKIIIGYISNPENDADRDNTIVKSVIDKVNTYLATQNSLYMIQDIDPNLKNQHILVIKRDIVGQDNIAESTDGGRTIESDTPEVVDATDDNHKQYEEKERINSLDDFYSQYKDEGNSTVEGDNNTEE